jgi:hypothetical protein
MRRRPPTALAVATLVLALGVAAPTAATAAPTIAAIPTAIPADCSRDVTAEILAWIASVPDGTTLRFARDGCYRVDGTLEIRDRNGLVLEGNHATFRAFTDGSELVNPARVRTRAVWSFIKGSSLALRNAITVGANPAAGLGEAAYQPKFEAQHAYQVQGTQTMVIDHVEAYDVYGDFVYVGAGTRNLVVRGSTFLRNGRQGWTINGTNIVFEGNSIGETRRATIDMEPTYPTWESRNVTIRNNTIGSGRLLFFASVGAAAPISNVSILDNRLDRAMTIYVDPPKGTRSNYRVIGNVAAKGFGSPAGAVWTFKDVVNLEIRDNVQPLQANRNMAGVALRHCSHVSVTGNQLPRATAAISDRGENVDLRQSGNAIGEPLAIAPPTVVPGPTPVPVR